MSVRDKRDKRCSYHREREKQQRVEALPKMKKPLKIKKGGWYDAEDQES